MSDPTYRFRGSAMPTEVSRASILEPHVEGDAAEMRLYDPIDSWGGWWGVSAKEVAAALALVPESVTTIHLRINSPGGEVWDALAIANQLRRHKARIVAHVDGIAASAASVIAVTCDEVVMGLGAQMMIHDAWNIMMGDAAALRASADRLTKDSDAIAALYARKAGGTAADWRAAMTAGPKRETWYSAEEAVAAGLADRLSEDVAEGAEEKAKALLAEMPGVHYRGGRAEAPAPVIKPRTNPAPVGAEPDTKGVAFVPLNRARKRVLGHPDVSEPGETTTETEGDSMSTLTDGLRQRLGITPDAELDDDAILAAVDEALAERAEATTHQPPAGTVLVDAAALEALKADAAAGRQARDRQESDDRERAVDAAIASGRILPARRDAWLANLEQDPGALDTLASLPQIVPTTPLGSTGGVESSTEDDDALYASIFGKEN